MDTAEPRYFAASFQDIWRYFAAPDEASVRRFYSENAMGRPIIIRPATPDEVGRTSMFKTFRRRQYTLGEGEVYILGSLP